MDGDAAAPFRVLLAEDDTISRTFLQDAIRACGGDPLACADGPSALALARRERFDLLVLDHRLPGLDGDAVLAALRADADGYCSQVPAIATSADADVARARLLHVGFAEVLAKPLPLEALRAALTRHGCPADPLDDACALRACGTPSAVEHLRRLFAEQELPRIQNEFERHVDHQSLRPMLHRLRASCGFCGATALARASETLHAALAANSDTNRIDAALGEFGRALRQARVALHAKLDGVG